MRPQSASTVVVSTRLAKPHAIRLIQQREERGEGHAERARQPIHEYQNLTMRMSRRRFTRLTKGFSKKLENHAATEALYFMYYNFATVIRWNSSVPPRSQCFSASW